MLVSAESRTRDLSQIIMLALMKQSNRMCVIIFSRYFQINTRSIENAIMVNWLFPDLRE